MAYGGMIRSEPFRSENGSTSYFCIVWGELSRDIKEKETKRLKRTNYGMDETGGARTLIEFCVKFRRKGFINCYIRSDCPGYGVARKMQAKDPVIAFGIYTVSNYVTKAGIEKTGYSMSVHSVVPAFYLDDPTTIARMSTVDADPFEGVAYDEEPDDDDVAAMDLDAFIQDDEEPGF